MQFSDTTNKDGLIQDCEDTLGFDATGISGNSNLLKTFTRWINEGYSIVAMLIMRVDGRMQWDDANHTNAPIAKFNLIQDQSSYQILESTPTALQDWLQFERFDISDENGNWKQLKKIDEKDIPIAESEFQETSSIPEWFDFKGNSVILYPAPNYNYTNGARMYFNRAPSYFASSDTTKRPGFATPYHHFLSMYASYRYASSRGMQISQFLRQELGQFTPNAETGLARDLMTFYQNRNKFEIPKIKRKYQNFK